VNSRFSQQLFISDFPTLLLFSLSILLSLFRVSSRIIYIYTTFIYILLFIFIYTHTDTAKLSATPRRRRMSVCSTALFCALRNIPIWAYILAFLLLKFLTSVVSRGIRGLELRLRPSIKAEKNGISREVAAEADRDRGDRRTSDRGMEE
jgi:hypothetical protein